MKARATGAALAALLLTACGPSTRTMGMPPGPGAPPAAPAAPAGARWGLVIHGGAGNITRQGLPPEREAEYRAAMEQAALAGWRVLERGGTSLDAVEAAINVMEDSPLFNAGKGAVFTHEGKNELDASIMDGATLRAGAVAGLRRVKNPIDLARAVMERSPHVMLTGAGAEEFAQSVGMELVPESYFYVEGRWRGLQRALEDERRQRTQADTARRGTAYSVPDDRKLGTVGAVALDRAGNLAAGTSTGGMTNKRWGRVGDAPIIGAGTYASNESCAVSATGHGEFFIRWTVARSICARVELLNEPLARAADHVVMGDLVRVRGEGGVIAMDPAGNVAWPFNSTGMYRARVGADGRVTVEIFRDEPR